MVTIYIGRKRRLGVTDSRYGNGLNVSESNHAHSMNELIRKGDHLPPSGIWVTLSGLYGKWDIMYTYAGRC